MNFKILIKKKSNQLKNKQRNKLKFEKLKKKK